VSKKTEILDPNRNIDVVDLISYDCFQSDPLDQEDISLVNQTIGDIEYILGTRNDFLSDSWFTRPGQLEIEYQYRDQPGPHKLQLNFSAFTAKDYFPKELDYFTKCWNFASTCNCEYPQPCQHISYCLEKEIDAVLIGALATQRSLTYYEPIITWNYGKMQLRAGAFISLIPERQYDVVNLKDYDLKTNKIRAVLITHGNGTSAKLDDKQAYAHSPLNVEMGSLTAEECSSKSVSTLVTDTCRYILDSSYAGWPCHTCGVNANRSDVTKLESNRIAFLNACCIVFAGQCMNCIQRSYDSKVAPSTIIPDLNGM